ncbi:MAG: AraC family transcriptional regulator [Kiritimatiellae bacterium]|nr:AraC family transcriptional regulator [Kiritimatiellia bacterium]
MPAARQSGASILDPQTGARILCYEITWSGNRPPETIPVGGDLNYCTLPLTGTLPHTHDFAEILLVSEGSLVHRANGEARRLQAGHLVFIRPDDAHGFEPDGQCTHCEIIVFDFQLEMFLTLSRYLENDTFLQAFTAPVMPPCFRLDATATNDLYGRLLRINAANAGPRLRKTMQKILLAELFARYFLDETHLLTETQVPDWLERLCTQMRRPENFTAGLERMRQLACRTPEHLCKVFRRHLGKTPTQFINELRINQAARLLSDTDETILAIAGSLRFESLSRFYALFHRQYGLSPARYRKCRMSGKRL